MQQQPLGIHLHDEGSKLVQGHSMHGIRSVDPSAFRLTFTDRSRLVAAGEAKTTEAMANAITANNFILFVAE